MFHKVLDKSGVTLRGLVIRYHDVQLEKVMLVVADSVRWSRVLGDLFCLQCARRIRSFWRFSRIVEVCLARNCLLSRALREGQRKRC